MIARRLLVLIIIIAINNSCGVIYYKVRSQSGKTEDITELSCGKILTSLSGKGRRQFSLDMIFETEAQFILKQDSLKVLFNNQDIDFINKESHSKGNVYLIKNNLSQRYHFEISEGVFDKDTIRIVCNNCISCGDTEFTSIGPFIYKFENKFHMEY